MLSAVERVKNEALSEPADRIPEKTEYPVCHKAVD